MNSHWGMIFGKFINSRVRFHMQKCHARDVFRVHGDVPKFGA